MTATALLPRAEAPEFVSGPTENMVRDGAVQAVDLMSRGGSAPRQAHDKDERPLSEAAFIAEVERALAASLSDDTMLDAAALPLVAAPTAKRARARLAFMLGRAFELDLAETLDVAVAVELVHAASLLHDDVLDSALARRGLPTANSLHGDVVAVLAGDLVLTRAMRRVLSLGVEAGLAAVDTIAEMSCAVAYEAAMRGRVLDREAWTHMAQGKTGALFGVVARLIGLASHKPHEAAVYEEALRHLGIAFQAADDLTDFAASGETPLVDLRDGNPSIAISVACELDDGLKADLTQAWRFRPLGTTLLPLAQRVLATGALDEVEDLIMGSVRRARTLLVDELSHPQRQATASRLLSWADGLVMVARAAGLGDSLARVPDSFRATTKEASP